MFNLIDKILGRKSQKERDQAANRRRDRVAAQAKAKQPALPAAPMKQKKFVPTQNDPEFYARSGQAKNEAEAQAMVNDYRKKRNPGIKPLF